MHLKGTAWYLNEAVFDKNWEFSRERKSKKTIEKCMKEVPRKTWESASSSGSQLLLSSVLQRPISGYFEQLKRLLR